MAVWCFTNNHKQIQDFKIKEMAAEMEATSPNLWELLDTLLSATKKESELDMPVEEAAIDEDDEYWSDNDLLKGLILVISVLRSGPC